MELSELSGVISYQRSECKRGGKRALQSEEEEFLASGLRDVLAFLVPTILI